MKAITVRSISKESMDLLENFNKVNVLIIGDIMIDRYWRGIINRISPEAPVPIVNLQETSVAAGGAANVAVNVAGLGANPYLIGITGKDEESELFPPLLEKANVSSDLLISFSDRRTTVKTRIVASQQHVVRLDQESVLPISVEQEEIVWSRIEKKIDEIDLIVVSDYAKGLLTVNLLKRLIDSCRSKNKKILIDPKGKDYSKYRGATLLTPNRREAAEACRFEENHEDLIEKSGNFLLKEIGVEGLLITQGEDGMTLFQNDKASLHLKAESRDVYDVTGAGDTVVATLAVAIGAGADFQTAAKLANIAAGIVVEHFGTTTIKFGELQKETKNSFPVNRKLTG